MHRRCRYSLSAFEAGAVVSSSLLGALAGSGVALVWGDRLGRRRELLGASVAYGAASLALALAPNLAALLAAHTTYVCMYV